MLTPEPTGIKDRKIFNGIKWPTTTYKGNYWSGHDDESPGEDKVEDSINSGERKKVRFERHSKWPDWHTMKCVLFLDPL